MEESVLRRLVPLMQAFPGMTPDRVWALGFTEWVILATAADEWLDRMREAERRSRG